MFAHLLKLIWNKKKQNALLLTEMFFSFLVMFAVFSLMVYEYSNYKKPMGFSYENVWAINVSYPDGIKRPDSMQQYQQTLKQLISTMPQVDNVAFSSRNIPFSANMMGNMVSYKKNEIQANNFFVEDDYYKVFNLSMKEGRWFSQADNVTKDKPVVINEALKNKIFGNENAIGKSISPNNMKVIGVVNDFKNDGDYQNVESGYFERADTSNIGSLASILVSVKPNTTAAFEARLYKTVSNYLTTSNLEIEHLSKKHTSKNSQTLVPMIILSIVAGFLIINVALGLFGVLWYNINKRRGEIGLRRAVGATGNSVSKQLVAEALVLSTISLIVGCFFAFQFPLLNVFDLPAGVYLIAIALAIAFIYLLVTICALYPGKQAAAIYPAVALHEE